MGVSVLLRLVISIFLLTCHICHVASINHKLESRGTQIKLCNDSLGHCNAQSIVKLLGCLNQFYPCETLCLILVQLQITKHMCSTHRSPLPLMKDTTANHIQSTLVISTSLISNNRLSRTEMLVPVLTQRSTNKILWKRGEIAP